MMTIFTEKSMNINRDIFVDTGAFIAMRVKDDINYKVAHDFLKVIREKNLDCIPQILYFLRYILIFAGLMKLR